MVRNFPLSAWRVGFAFVVSYEAHWSLSFFPSSKGMRVVKRLDRLLGVMRTPLFEH